MPVIIVYLCIRTSLTVCVDKNWIKSKNLPSLKSQEDDNDQEVVVMEEDMVFMESEEDWDGDDLGYNIDNEGTEIQYECN